MSNHGREYGPAFRFEQIVPRRSEQLLQLQPVEGTDFLRNAKDIASDISDSIIEDPTKSQVIGMIARPDDGKTTFQRQMVRWMTRSGGKLDNHLHKIGGAMRVDVISWRDLWQGKHTVEPLAPNYPDKKEKQKEIDLVNENLADGLATTIGRYFQYPDTVLRNDPSERFFVEYGTNAPLAHIVLFDAPPLSGTRTEDGQVGIVRAEKVIANLSSHQGDFKGLNYNFTGVGIAASPEVRGYGLETRAIVKKITDPEERTAALNKRGVFVHGQQDLDINEYVAEGASPAEADELEGDMIDTILYLVDTQKIKLPNNYQLTKSELEKNDALRYHLVAKGLLPWLFTQRLGIFPYHGGILDNNKIHSVIDVPYDLPDEHHPMKEIYAKKPW